ncbi:MAG: hypothetical protein JWN03_6598 [Nocardia sp.]|uniref:hypothetical protein n=1 Tax=Nocardia sp. TaxID=1821 RepID=UPI00262D4253|nr:hypothetical protein [Nocardia sp.]MCU1646323.1 hypothetical protein [Nocardia sp.]
MYRTVRLIVTGAVAAAALTAGAATASADTGSVGSGFASGSSGMVVSIVRALEYSPGASSGSSNVIESLMVNSGSFSYCDRNGGIVPNCWVH